MEDMEIEGLGDCMGGGGFNGFETCGWGVGRGLNAQLVKWRGMVES